MDRLTLTAQTHFNLFPTDILQTDDKKNVGAFLRLARGDEFVDHHALFFTMCVSALRDIGSSRRMPDPHIHHCSFEIHDTDMQMLSHK